MSSNKLANAIRKSYAMGPSVRNLLTHYKLNPSSITSTGPHETLLKSDVLSYIGKQKLNHTSPRSTSQVQFTSTGVSQSFTTSKPIVHNISDSNLIRSKYPRRYPNQAEIDVINNGGRL